MSEGCRWCYADTQAKRNPRVLGVWGPQGTRVLASESMWREPLKWNKVAEKMKKERKCPSCGHYWWRSFSEPGIGSPCPSCGSPSYRPRHRVFCASMADVFEGPDTCNPDAYAVIREGRRRLFDLIAKTPNLDWLLLTKRPENWEKAIGLVCTDDRHDENFLDGALLCGKWLHGNAPSNVWMGTSVENQLVADTRIPALLEIPAAMRFLSCEPLLGEVNIWKWLCDECDQCERPMPRHIGGCFDPWDGDDDCDGRRKVLPKIGWVIGGGESGPNARPVNHFWAEYLQRQCQNASVPFFWKQWGEWFPRYEWQYNPDLVLPDDYNTYNELDPKTVMVGGSPYHKVGKNLAGCSLYGREYSEIPTVEATNG